MQLTWVVLIQRLKLASFLATCCLKARKWGKNSRCIGQHFRKSNNVSKKSWVCAHVHMFARGLFVVVNSWKAFLFWLTRGFLSFQ